MQVKELTMKSDADDNKKRSSSWKVILFAIVTLAIVVPFILPPFIARLHQSIVAEGGKPQPPDLSRCTHLEIHYPSIIKFASLIGVDPNFLSAAETDRLQSLEKFVIDDKKGIRGLARVVSSGSYKGVLKKDMPIPMGKPTLSITSYRNDERIASITMYGPTFVTDKGHWFDYDKDLPNLWLLAPQHMRPLTLRMLCGLHLWVLYDESLWPYQKTKVYPSPTEWCDIVVRHRQNSELSDEKIKELLRCPTAGEGKCHYAMNPNCEPNSPQDTVLLFETKAGWNQHGGPELFTFDNHDPKGGCVLLNDGTVKFIRTKEELQQLRWK